MGARQERYELAQNPAPGQTITPRIQKLINNDVRIARLHTVTREPEDTGFVRDTEHIQYAVDLPARTCTCKQFQLNLLPCSHALALILEL